ncbi:hypothetical protein [Treponema endosymbiont of Eucomonympha sp.]|uniref:hypothetical protein n=1 Tax=Treponema endosymbiont of Eucomonympha sp. TaxID=1580831 RepID=UPI00165089FA|nr:hypothetical protein [Treponema endosymbiont of Eucomonympha sp.]
MREPFPAVSFAASARAANPACFPAKIGNFLVLILECPRYGAEGFPIAARKLSLS